MPIILAIIWIYSAIDCFQHEHWWTLLFQVVFPPWGVIHGIALFFGWTW